MTHFSVEELLQQYTHDSSARKREFYRYYSHKRIQHQMKQLEMLEDVDGEHLTEVGSYLGFATALFLAAGFKVQTIDAGSKALLGEIVPGQHIEKNILEITREDLAGQNVIVCCETLEHLHYPDAEKRLEEFYASDAEWLLISVPYRCMSIYIHYIKNPFSKFFSWIVKFPTKKFKDFKPHPEPHGHKWELGYKGYPLEKLTGTLSKTGYGVQKIDYVGAVQSVFILSRKL